jgi:rubrerythrin
MKSMNELPEVWRLAIRREVEARDSYARMAQAATDQGTRLCSRCW